MTTPTQSDEQRVKEVYPDATSYVFDGGCCILPKPSVAYFERISGWFDVESSAWHDAASRLSKVEAAVSGKRNECEGCGEPVYLTRHYGYSHVDTTLNCGCDARPKASHESVPKAAPPVAEPAPQTFEEWWAYMTTGSVMLNNEFFKVLTETAWNAAKASSPATVPRDIAHTLWNEGGRLRTELAASLGMHPENWHKEGLQQRIAEWDKAAERYFDYAFSGTVSSPVVAGGESETADGANLMPDVRIIRLGLGKVISNWGVSNGVPSVFIEPVLGEVGEVGRKIEDGREPQIKADSVSAGGVILEIHDERGLKVLVEDLWTALHKFNEKHPEPLKCSDCVLIHGKSVCTMNCGPLIKDVRGKE